MNTKKQEEEVILKLIERNTKSIMQLETCLNNYNSLNNLYLDEICNITDEEDNGKKKFTNAEKRENEFIKRFPDEHKQLQSLRIEIEILRLTIKLYTQSIDLSTKTL